MTTRKITLGPRGLIDELYAKVYGLAAKKTIPPSQLGTNITSAGGTPTTTVHAAAGGGATATVTGNDTAGTIILTTGNAPTPSAGAQVDINFTQAFAAAPNGVSLTPKNQNAATTSGVFVGVSPTALTIDASSGNALAPLTIYAWSYVVIG